MVLKTSAFLINWIFGTVLGLISRNSLFSAKNQLTILSYNNRSILERLSKIKFDSRVLSHTVKELFRAFSYKKSRKPLKQNKGFRRCSLASIRGFEPPTPCLGELLNNCHTCSPEFTVVVRCLPTQISSFECENPTAIELKIETCFHPNP